MPRRPLTQGRLAAASLALLLLISCLAAISGCQSAPPVPSGPALTAAGSPVTYVTSVYPLYVAALNLTAGIPGTTVTNLTGTVTGCLHDYHLTPRNMQTLEEASAFLINGAGLESYLDQLAKSRPNLVTINASTGIELLADNPHVWVSLDLMIHQVQTVAAGMAACDPAHAAQYQANAVTYTGKLETLRLALHSRLDPLRQRNIVTFHEAFPYFAQEFNLNIAAVVEREPDSQPSASELAATINQIRSLQVRAIFVEPQYAAETAQTIAKETGVPVYTLDPAASGPLDDPDAYLRIMRSNGEVLVTALQDG